MNIVGDKSIFIAMKQNGPFVVEDEVNVTRSINGHAREWARLVHSDPSTVAKYRAVRTQIFDLLQIDSFNEIPRLIASKDVSQARSHRAYALLANLYGISGDISEVKSRIRGYALGADQVIGYLKTTVLQDYDSSIEISNEIEARHEPLDLLLITFNPAYHKKARFEAKRKLVLMALAGSIDQRERETDIENKFSAFLDFLNRHVWSPELKIGELKTTYLYSQHDTADFRCTSVKVIEDPDEAAMIRPGAYEKLTLIKRRLFKHNRNDIPAYVTVRKKDMAAKILKLLRKNEKNPAVAVDDELGLMAVLDSIADVKKFVRHLTHSAIDANSIMVLEDISDTLTGGYYHGKSTGSSSMTPMLKFFARLGGMRVEFIIHTNETYLNYRYQKDIAHSEYEVKRLFDSGVAQFLFPEDIYHLDMETIRDQQLQNFRKKIESSSS
jgi:hypothetical protein